MSEDKNKNCKNCNNLLRGKIHEICKLFGLHNDDWDKNKNSCHAWEKIGKDKK